jgi:rRNA maturation RNase YbeY
MKEIPIYFFKEGIRFRLSKRKEIITWLENVLKKNNCSAANINFIFCTDAYLRKINKKYLHHDYNTDIVTFDNTTEKNKIEGDLFISVDRVKVNAKTYAVSFTDELHRVMVHGILHLMGNCDGTQKEKLIIRSLEDHWLKQRKF